MFWADEVAQKVSSPQIINDSWTPSGKVHIGSLKGPILHDTLFRVLKKKNSKTVFLFGIDDMDPIDGLPQELLKSHQKYFGFPLFLAPSPDEEGSFADYFTRQLEEVFQKLDIDGEIYRVEKLYRAGKFNEWIEKALDNAFLIRKIYKEVSGSKKGEDWYPFQVICPNCQKLGTTKVIGWDGKEVSFYCEENLVSWARGCGAKGKTSPFDGNGKLVWRVEWAAKWALFGVTIEAAGKDHASSGGSYDVSGKICEDVFDKKMPMKIPYEHFLSNGKKMSSSKGVGLSAEELFEVMPPQLIRFLIIKTPVNQAVEFTPSGTDVIPKLYDDYQKAAEGSDRAYILSQIGKIQKPPSIRFSLLTQWVQMPNMEEKIKKEGLEEWAKYARVWVEKFAPEEGKFTVKEELPEAALHLSAKQKMFLTKIGEELANEWQPAEFEKRLYQLSQELELPGKEAFSAIYFSLIGKDHGPKAAWLILSLEKKFVKKRFKEATIT